MRLVSPSSAPPVAVSVLLAAAVSQPGLVLAWQTACSEGFKFTPRRPPPVLTSSSALTLERHLNQNPVSTCHEVEEVGARPGTAQSNASTYYLAPSARAASPMPGVPVGGGDAKEVRGVWGRAWEMAQPHPKLLVLPTKLARSESAEVSGFRSVARQGHARLRSFKLSKTSLRTLDRSKTGRATSRVTMEGLECLDTSVEGEVDATGVSRGLIPVDVVVQALLKEPARPRPSSFIGNSLLPFTLGTGPITHSSPDLTASASAVAGDLLNASKATGPFEFRAHIIQLPTSTSNAGVSEPWPVSSTPKNRRVTIDYLSSKVLPELVPELVVGRRMTVEGREFAVHDRPRRRTSLGAVAIGMAEGGARNRNVRNLCEKP